MEQNRADLNVPISSIPSEKFLSMQCGFARIIITSGPISISRHVNDVHDHYEILIPLSEFSSLYIERKRIVCQPGNLLVINPGQKHGTSKSLRKVSFVSVFFDRVYMDDLIRRITGEVQPFPNYIQNMRQEFQNLISLTIEEFRESKAGRDVLLEALSEIMAVYLIRTYHQPIYSPRHDLDKKMPEYQARFTDVISYMHEHLGEKITIDQLAAVALMNRYHFIRSFRSAFGSSPYDYLTSLRINQAKHLLGTTLISASEIGVRCGFFSASRFSAAFRMVTGMTPTRYRQHTATEKSAFSGRNENEPIHNDLDKWQDYVMSRPQ